jgi:hypothetical protein
VPSASPIEGTRIEPTVTSEIEHTGASRDATVVGPEPRVEELPAAIPKVGGHESAPLSASVPPVIAPAPAAPSSAPVVAGRPNAASAAAFMEQAQRMLDHGNAPRATELARKATAADPQSPEAWLTLGAAYDAAGSRSLARTAYRSCVETGVGPRVAECRALLDH